MLIQPPARGAAGTRGGRGGGRGGATMRRPRSKPPTLPPNPTTPGILARYRAAVDTAVKLATMYNIQPIRGSTLVIVDGTNCMEPVSGRTRSIGQGITTGEVATLLALMFRHACEDCDFVVSFWRLGCSTFPGLVEGKVLANVATVYSHMIRGRGKSEDGPYVGVAWRYRWHGRIFSCSRPRIVYAQACIARTSALGAAAHRQPGTAHVVPAVPGTA